MDIDIEEVKEQRIERIKLYMDRVRNGSEESILSTLVLVRTEIDEFKYLRRNDTNARMHYHRLVIVEDQLKKVLKKIEKAKAEKAKAAKYRQSVKQAIVARAAEKSLAEGMQFVFKQGIATAQLNQRYSLKKQEKQQELAEKERAEQLKHDPKYIAGLAALKEQEQARIDENYNGIMGVKEGTPIETAQAIVEVNQAIKTSPYSITPEALLKALNARD